MSKTSLQRIIVHIGPGKTGTSSLQASLTCNASLLVRQGFLYPTFWGPRGVVGRDNILSWEKELWEAINKTSPHTLLISSEFLQHAHQEIDNLASLLGIPSKHVRIIATVRDHESRYVSNLHQIVKGHYDVSRVRPLRWVSFMPAWEEKFGVSYVPYLDVDSEMNLVERLWHTMCGQLPPVNASWENRSQSAEQSYLLQEFHKRNFWGQPRKFRPEANLYQKALKSIEESHGNSTDARDNILKLPWAKAIQTFTRDDRQFLAERSVPFQDYEDESGRDEPSDGKPKKWVGPAGIEDVLEVNFDLAQAMRKQLKDRLANTPGLEDMVL